MSRSSRTDKTRSRPKTALTGQHGGSICPCARYASRDNQNGAAGLYNASVQHVGGTEIVGPRRPSLLQARPQDFRGRYVYLHILCYGLTCMASDASMMITMMNHPERNISLAVALDLFLPQMSDRRIWSGLLESFGVTATHGR